MGKQEEIYKGILKMDFKILLALVLFVSSVASYQISEDERNTDSKDLKDQVYDYLYEKFENQDENNDEESEKEINNEENDDLDTIDLNDDLDEADIDRIGEKHDPLWRRWRFRTPRIRVPRIRVPRIRIPRIRIPRIRIPRIRVPRIRIPRIRVPRIRVPRIRFPRIRLPRIPFRKIRIPNRGGNPSGPDTEKEIDCSHATGVFNSLGCDATWKKHVHAVFVDQVFRMSCIKHAVCVSCMQAQPWTKAQCDNRLKTDMEVSCEKITGDDDKPDAEMINYCKTRVFGLQILAATKPAPSSKAYFCDACIMPSGNPSKAVEL